LQISKTAASFTRSLWCSYDWHISCGPSGHSGRSLDQNVVAASSTAHDGNGSLQTSG